MATFVHLTPAGNVPRIRRSGIRAVSHGYDSARGVYCFPVLPSFTLTHQWLRELAHWGGQGRLVAVHIRLDDSEPVFTGHYGGPHAEVRAAEAVGRILELDDPRGWEVFVPRKVLPQEVRSIRTVPQVAGWRYQPDAHGRRPCTCYGCRVRGGYGARRLRERLPHPLDGPAPPTRELLARLTAAGDPGDPTVLREVLHWLAMRRKGPVPELARLASHPDPAVREDLVWTISRWTTPGVPALLDTLADDPHPDVREAAETVRDPTKERTRLPNPPP
ncbi:HEAT repeat domain-containing protein [Actinomadura rupiterrae]|uniref:HEAT repeat domain-containing protein n=1 Tax=Actinomadura rupiterrae TaxID=559627 RepID=UPI0020A4E526|nr:HEAT repeat domain-containing protein [Actinomadura rupiterrae]MCP2341966.1 hypothetical protein [Actinomadura rupiterrae]